MSGQRNALIAAMISLAIVACAPVAPETQVSEPLPAEPVYAPTPGLSPKARLLKSLALLEEGDAGRARVEVVAYLERVPRSSIAQDLLLQIDTDPDVYFPTESRPLVVREGQSLSNVAKTYLGSPYQFYALARYNDISRPRRVVPGQIIRVPLTPEAIDAFAREQAGEAESDVDNVSVVEVLAEDSAVDAEVTEADAVLPTDMSAEADAGADGAIDASGDAEADRDADGAVPPDAAPAVAAPVAMPEPSIDVDALHREAIHAFRAQDLDTAIELWDQILSVDPDYEGARLYRSQAEALKERLRKLQ